MAYQAINSLKPSQPKVVTEFDLADTYYKWFDVVRCDTPELIERSQRLRYQVYCLETQFENPNDNPNGIEKDDADAHSLHSLLIHRSSSTVAGTVRLILPKAGEPDMGQPSRRVSKRLQSMAEYALPGHRTGEISRFSISKEFRKRVEDGLYPDEDNAQDPEFFGRRAIPSITLGLMRAIVEMASENGIEFVTAVVEPALIRLLQRLGIYFERTGERVDYHGVRYPVYRHLGELLGEIYTRQPAVWHAITDRGRLWPLEAPKPRQLLA